jgi:hypothetical protein
LQVRGKTPPYPEHQHQLWPGREPRRASCWLLVSLCGLRCLCPKEEAGWCIWSLIFLRLTVAFHFIWFLQIKKEKYVHSDSMTVTDFFSDCLLSAWT